MENLLQVKNIKKKFKVPNGMLHAVDGVSFDLNSGETLGVVGESGCGKSTLGRCILQLIQPTEGEIYFQGKKVSGLKGEELRQLKKDMQIIFQDPFSSLNPRMTAKESISDPLRVFGMCNSKSELDDRVSKIMDTVGLAKRFINSYPHELDGGRRQRICIARALILNPKFIVCDEPVSALDVSIQAQILNLMQDLQEEHDFSYLFITHDLSVVKHISNRIIVMYLGMMVEIAQADDLFNRPLHPYTKALLSAIPVASTEKREKRVLIKGEITSPVNPKPGCRFAPRCPYAKDVCFTSTPELSDLSNGHQVACHFIKEINNF